MSSIRRHRNKLRNQRPTHMNDTPPMPPIPIPLLNPNGPPMRKFAVKMRLPDGQWAQGEVQSLDHITALVKLTAWLSDQPIAPAQIILTDLQQAPVIVPATQVPIIRK